MPESLTMQETKEQLLWVAKEMLISNLVQGTAGNCAARLPDGNAVLTPGSLDYMEMTLDDLVVCDLDGNVLAGHRKPTSEKALHLGALKLHEDIGASVNFKSVPERNRNRFRNRRLSLRKVRLHDTERRAHDPLDQSLYFSRGVGCVFLRSQVQS